MAKKKKNPLYITPGTLSLEPTIKTGTVLPEKLDPHEAFLNTAEGVYYIYDNGEWKKLGTAGIGEGISFSYSSYLIDLEPEQIIEPTFTTTFNNTVYTDIEITINGETKTCPVGGSCYFTFDSNPGSYSYYAETSG